MILSVQKAMHLLSILSDFGGAPVSLLEISELCHYPKPTVAHLLATLSHDGYVTHDPEAHRYALGPRTYYLGRHGRYSEELVSICRPIMRWMEKKSHGTVVLSVIHSRQKYIIDYEDREQQIFSEHANMRIGDIYRTATGRILLSHMEPDAIREIYEEYGAPHRGHWSEVTSFESLVAELEKIRKKKIVITEPIAEQEHTNAWGFASPVMKNGKCIGAIGIAYRVTECEGVLDEKTKKELICIVQRGTGEIERRLSYEGE